MLCSSMAMFVFPRCAFIKSKGSLSIFNLLTYHPELMVRVETMKKCANGASLSLNRGFCSDATGRPASSAMDALIKNLQTKLNVSKTVKRSVVPHPQPIRAIVSPRKLHPPAFRENPETDTAICSLLKADVHPTEVISALKKYAIENKFPSRKTLGKMVGACAGKGHLEGIQAANDVCEIAFPAEAVWQMNYRHYEAEVHWRHGNYERSLKIFQDLFEMHPLRRRKLINMCTFLMRHVVNNGLTAFYPKLLAFVEFCQSHGEVVPAANLWRAAFCSDSYSANCLAEELLTKHHKTVLSVIEGKVQAILEEAQTLKKVDTIQRLMQFVLNYELKEHYPAVFGAYMDYMCDGNDVDGAIETFNFICKSSIIISAESVKKFFDLLVLHKKKPPNLTLIQNDNKADVTTNRPTTPSGDFKF